MWKRGREKEVCDLSGFACSTRMDKWVQQQPQKKRKRKERSRNDGEREQTPDPLVNREKKERREKESFNLLSLVSDRLCAV